MDEGGEGAVGVRADAGQLGEFEVGGAELIPELDDLVGIAAIDAEVERAELTPAGGDALEPGGVTDVMEGCGLGGGTASGDGTEGLALAEERGEIEADGLIGLGMRLVHFYHMRKWARFATFFGDKLLKTIKATGGFWGEFAPFRRSGDSGTGLAPGVGRSGTCPISANLRLAVLLDPSYAWAWRMRLRRTGRFCCRCF
ncbi:MAG: hypothetical protein ACLQKA_21485, partial [Bryobacteraceae bacterium]